EAIAAVRELVPRWSTADAAPLAAATGLTPSEAVYLLAGCPNAGDRSANFLPKELRESLGLKAAQAAVARDALAAIPRNRRLAVLALAGRGGELAEVWIQFAGMRIAIPEELIADADRELQAPIPPSQALAMFGAANAPQLTTDGAWGLGQEGGVMQVSQPTPLVGQAKIEDPAVFA